MIIDYHRPKTLNEAIRLVSQTDQKYNPLAGGTAIDQHPKDNTVVVDLQDLGLNQIIDRGNTLEIGATATLQRLLDEPRLQPEFKKAVHHETTYNLRQVATVAGTFVSATGRSPFATACLALDAKLVIQPDEVRMALGDFLFERSEILKGRLITQIILPVNVHFRYEYTARTPADQPIVCVGVARWPSGRTRVALGGFGLSPKLAMDGPDSGGAETAAIYTFSNASDQWASADYRQEIAGILTRRCTLDLDQLKLEE
jgi:CO/xanthine dehydrogenase FAD-binding subunit